MSTAAHTIRVTPGVAADIEAREIPAAHTVGPATVGVPCQRCLTAATDLILDGDTAAA